MFLNELGRGTATKEQTNTWLPKKELMLCMYYIHSKVSIIELVL